MSNWIDFFFCLIFCLCCKIYNPKSAAGVQSVFWQSFFFFFPLAAALSGGFTSHSSVDCGNDVGAWCSGRL